MTTGLGEIPDRHPHHAAISVMTNPGRTRMIALSGPPSMRIAIYPGSFDPVTNGHLDVIDRAARLFDKVIVAVAYNESKTPLFSPAERLDLLRQSTIGVPNLEFAHFTGLLVDYVNLTGACAIVRGLRAISDFEFEFQMALMNRKLDPTAETIFLMPREEYSYLSSRMVREVARLGGDITQFVPTAARIALMKKLSPPAR